MNNVKIDCPNCGHPVIVRTTTVDDAPEPKTFKPWPSKENRDKIMEEMEKMQKAMTDGFRQIFDKSLWK